MAGEMVQTFTPVPTFEQMRALSLADQTERRARQAVFFHRALQMRRRLGQGVHDRWEAYIFADGAPGDAADRAGLELHLPVPSRQLSVLHKRVRTGQVWDLTVPPELLGLNERDDLLNVVNIGELVIEPGGYVVVQGNLLILGCQSLRQVQRGHPSQPGAATEEAHGRPMTIAQERLRSGIAVLATPTSVDARTGPFHGRGGRPGTNGGPGRAGRPPAGVPTMLGVDLLEPPGQQMDGSDGGPGAGGGHGEPGRTGGATKTAEISIGRLSGSLTLLVAGGQGGDGGMGGHGGNGGPGGNGAPGLRTLSGPVPSGRPGRGGHGGDGGDGGHGGNGGICSNIFVTVPAAMTDQVHVLTCPAAGATGGPGGWPGYGGTAGHPAHAPANHAKHTRPAAGAGATGTAGNVGRDGLTRPGPQVFINGKPL